MTTLDHPTCRTCLYFHEERLDPRTPIAQMASGQGECWRYPPVPVVVPTPSGVQIPVVRPAVLPGAWCGEHTATTTDMSTV